MGVEAPLKPLDSAWSRDSVKITILWCHTCVLVRYFFLEVAHVAKTNKYMRTDHCGYRRITKNVHSAFKRPKNSKKQQKITLKARKSRKTAKKSQKSKHRFFLFALLPIQLMEVNFSKLSKRPTFKLFYFYKLLIFSDHYLSLMKKRLTFGDPDLIFIKTANF